MKKGLILGINPCIHGLNYHDPSVCLVDKDGIIFAIEEERLNGIKHSNGLFPTLAVNECIKIAHSLNNQITDICIGHQPQLWENRGFSDATSVLWRDPRLVLSTFIRNASGLNNATCHFYEHHLSHAASAYYFSGFNKALCVVFDGAAEISAASIWLADNGSIQKLDEIPMPNSLGYFYAQATAFIGFQPWNEEGKLMALAPYGHSEVSIEKILDNWFAEDGSDYNVSNLVEGALKNGYFLDLEKSSSLLCEYFSVSDRRPNDPILDFHKNFAYSVQKRVERAVCQYITKWLNFTGSTNLCCSGGLFMNCKMNGIIRDVLPINKIFIQPVSGDAGTAIGASLLRLNEIGHKPTTPLDLSIGLGFTDSEIEYSLQTSSLKYRKSQNIVQDTAKLIADGKIICWFQGRSEIGSRALCHRSILAPPFPTTIANEINARIKHRELWRPFACSILNNNLDGIFVNFNKSQSPFYMIEAFKVKEEWENRFKAVMHPADHTTRPQVINDSASNTLIQAVISEFYKRTGYPMILNTSLNDKGQPIITYPAEAIDFFIKHDVDALVIGSFILEK